MSLGEPVRVVYRKYDQALHWNLTMYRLGEDEHGVWLGAPADSTGRRGHEEPIVWPEPFVTLFPRDAWYTALLNAEPNEVAWYCDVTTRPTWRDGLVTMVDLDLDVVRRRDGVTYVDDEDEFAEHRVRYAYPADVVATAERTCRDLYAAVAAGDEPFADVGRSWLAKVS
ncbi:MAG: DUF402 domain-containing protein [Streptosporangiales bacterium]|nr:DUF402 domain-containing protein [Streptosporangiales bacterium]MBO0891454.1 DUF402 domain-containing protein [Acidothermales bacterium]